MRNKRGIIDLLRGNALLQMPGFVVATRWLLAMTARYEFAISPHVLARVSACSFRPLQSEGAGNAGRPMRPIAACAMIAVERTRVSQVTPGNTRHSPRNGFTAYFALSPAIGLFVTVACGNDFPQT
jgi:hypothetical protein